MFFCYCHSNLGLIVCVWVLRWSELFLQGLLSISQCTDTFSNPPPKAQAPICIPAPKANIFKVLQLLNQAYSSFALLLPSLFYYFSISFQSVDHLNRLCFPLLLTLCRLLEDIDNVLQLMGSMKVKVDGKNADKPGSD